MERSYAHVVIDDELHDVVPYRLDQRVRVDLIGQIEAELGNGVAGFCPYGEPSESHVFFDCTQAAELPVSSLLHYSIRVFLPDALEPCS